MSEPPESSEVPRHADVIQLPQHVPPPAAIAIVSGKGGVGRTHIAVNLACLWRDHGHRVLCLDADVALGGADLLLGVAPTSTIADVVDGRASAADAIVHAPSGVDLLAASAGRWDLSVLGDERRHSLLSAVDELESRYDAVIIDTPGGLTPDALGFCAAATDVVAVVTPEPASVEAACAWLAALAHTSSIRRVFVLVNLVPSDTAGREVFRRVVRRSDHHPTISARISLNYIGALPIDPAVTRAGLRGEPFWLADARGPAAAALHRASDLLCQAAAQHGPTVRTSGGLFWRRQVRTSSTPHPRSLPLY